MIDRQASLRRPPLSIEFLLGDLLENRVEDFRVLLASLGSLVCEALKASGTVEAGEELFDRRRWDSAVGRGTAPRPRVAKLTSSLWGKLTTSDDLWGLGIHLRPLPYVPERYPFQSDLDLFTAWYRQYPNPVTVAISARFLDNAPPGWGDRLITAFTTFCVAASAQTAYIGWARPMQYRYHPLGTVDFCSTLMEPGWAMLISEGHVRRLGGLAGIKDSPLFGRAEQLVGRDGRSVYLVRSAGDLFDPAVRDMASKEWLARLEVLSPVILGEPDIPRPRTLDSGSPIP